MRPLEGRDRAPLPGPETKLPGDFRGADLARDPSTYTLVLEASERRALEHVAHAWERGAPRDDAEVHGILARVTQRAKEMLTRGHGVVRVRGIPTRGLAPTTTAALLTTAGTALGEPMAQNLEGERVTDIRDTGADASDPAVRLYTTRAEQDFHTDGADVIGLLSLHAAARGGMSRIVSSVRVFKEIAAVRPDLAPLLAEPFFFRVPGAQERGLPPALPRPIVQYDGTKLESFFIGWYIRNAQGLEGVPPLSDAQRTLLALYEATANDPALYLDMALEPGDLQWLRNAFVLHKRTAYEDAPAPAPKRHLQRLWLSARFLDDATPRFEQGEVRA